MPWGWGVALRMAMKRAIDDAGVDADAVLIDGDPVHVSPKEVTLVKGDARVCDIAAAPIVAKVTRDALMVSLAEEYPEYHLAECKGYGSPEHIAAIQSMAFAHTPRILLRKLPRDTAALLVFLGLSLLRLACEKFSSHSFGFERLQRLWVLANPELPISLMPFEPSAACQPGARVLSASCKPMVTSSLSRLVTREESAMSETTFGSRGGSDWAVGGGRSHSEFCFGHLGHEFDGYGMGLGVPGESRCVDFDEDEGLEYGPDGSRRGS